MKKALLLTLIFAFCACSSIQTVEQEEEPVLSITAALEEALTLVIPYRSEEAASVAEEGIPELIDDPDHLPNQFLFIEGTAEKEEHLEAFLWAFGVEAGGAGYTVMASKEEAAYTFKFDVSANRTDEGGFHEYENQYIVRISLVENSNDEEILFFNFYFTEIDEIYERSQSLFNMATVYIPPGKRDIYYTHIVDRSWQNKWVYFRASLDYPISFFALQPIGLFGNRAAYMPGPTLNSLPESTQILDHIILPQPGLTVSVEAQFLNFLGAELGFKFNLGNPETYSFLNVTMNLAVKFNLKTENFMIQPYIGGLIPLVTSDDVFDTFPGFAMGAGVQAGVKGGRNGVIFVDLNFMYSFGEVLMRNRYAKTNSNGMAIAPMPALIHYKHFVFGIGIGYKFGILNRQ
ncbi:MAG: hypothetical protein FWC21_02055 [Treponema sp.]|nr:hypothetical protein [Treponema sp.]